MSTSKKDESDISSLETVTSLGNGRLSVTPHVAELPSEKRKKLFESLGDDECPSIVMSSIQEEDDSGPTIKASPKKSKRKRRSSLVEISLFSHSDHNINIYDTKEDEKARAKFENVTIAVAIVSVIALAVLSGVYYVLYVQK